MQFVPKRGGVTEHPLSLMAHLDRLHFVRGTIRVRVGRRACVAGPGDMARWKQSWSDDDLNRLRKLAGTKPITVIAKELGRTTGTVLAKAIEQKLPVIHRIERTSQGSNLP